MTNRLLASSALLVAAIATTSQAFTPRMAPSRARVVLKAEFNDEFSEFLQEGSPVASQSSQSHRRIVLGKPNPNQQQNNLRTTILASSFPAPTTESPFEAQGESSETTELDPFADETPEALQKIQQFEQQQQKPVTIDSKLKSMDLQDIIITFVIPGIALFAAGRWGYNRLSSRLGATSEATLEQFAREMLYHDGNQNEMKLCVDAFTKKLLWMPNRADVMVKTYLQAYAKRKTISPKAIASLSYAFTLFNLSEAKAAQTLVSLCREMGTDKISSAGKLLFLGSRILKSPEGLLALEPIKDLIKSTYRDERVAETLVETSQHAIAEAAYRNAVQSGGKNQDSLTPGWQVLGLDEATASSIFEDEAKDGFLTDREQMYGGQSIKYDKHGHALDKDGSYVDPADAEKAKKLDEEDNNGGGDDE